MIELPEAYNIANQLNNVLKNKKILSVSLFRKPHTFAFVSGDQLYYESHLNQKKFIIAKQVGGMVEIIFDDVSLILSDGSFPYYYESFTEIPSQDQLLLYFSDDSALSIKIQMYGSLLLNKTKDMNYSYYLSAKNNVSPLSEEFNITHLNDLIEKAPSSATVKMLLSTEQRIPGLGNGVLQDIIFNAKLNPRMKISNLTKEQKQTLLNVIKTTLIDMINKNGRDTEKDIFGNYGRYRTIMSKNNSSQLCPICQNKIIKEAYLGGSVYYCPKCQPKE